MAFLTDRSLASGVTSQDLIHIVIPTDISQNPAGSSYKATIEQVMSGFTAVTIYEEGLGVDSTQRIGVGADASGGYSVVSGGKNNTSICGYSTVSGGFFNTVSGTTSTISGGYQNKINGGLSIIGGGQINNIYGNNSTIGGGQSNNICGNCSFIGGGYENILTGNTSMITGGYSNEVLGDYSFLGGGYCNTISGYYSTLSGGYCNTASNYYSTVSGGYHNTASCAWATVSGGYYNTSETYSTFIGGGGRNTTSGWYATISGGRLNTATGACSTIAGGCNNVVACTLSSIGGGQRNTINCVGSTISGGYNNFIGSGKSSILGGSGNTVSHNYSSAVGFGVTSVSACTFHVNYLALQDVPETDVQTTTQYLTRDSSTGVVKTKIIPGPTVYGLYAQTGDSTIVSSATTPTTLIGPGIGTLSVPANGFTIGDSFRVKMAGIISNPSNNDISIRVKTNSVVLAQNSTPFNLTSHSNDVFDLEVDFTIRNTGSAGVASVMTLGKFYTVLKNGSNVQGTSFENLENTLFDTTIPNTLDIEVIWGQVDGGDSIYSRTFVLNKVY
jgi:hypothetical protein